MKQIRLPRIVACLAGLAAAVAPRWAAAQVGTPPTGAGVSVMAGGRAYLGTFDSTQRAKLEEFRDLRSGPVLMRLDLHWLSPDSHYGLWAGTANSGQRDASYWLRSSRVGRFDFQARLDETPHTYSTTAHLIGTETSPGVFTLPTPRPDTATINASSVTDPVRQRWDVARVSMKYDPSKQWDMRAQYTRTRKTGDRPMGMAFGGPGNNHRELPEPIQQTVHDLSLVQEVSKGKLQAQARYNLSAFENDLQSVTSDNPLVVTDAATTGSSRGRSALAPNNIAQSLTATGAFSLPSRTRITATAMYGWLHQNQAFLPATINSAITNPALDSLRSSLEGNVHTTLLQLAATSVPVRGLSLSAHVRSYDYTDKTPAFTSLAHVVNDRTLDTADVESDRLSYGRRDAAVDARYRIAMPLSVSVGWNWDQWRRDSLLRSNIGKLNDNTIKGGINVQPLGWGVVRAIYSQSWRRSPTPYIDDDPSTLATLRRFDLADRDRHRFDVIGEVTPVGQITLSGSYGRWHDNFINSAYGLQDDNSWAAGGGITVVPTASVSLGVSYERERSTVREQSRSRSGAQPDNLTWDFIGTTLNATDTYGADLNAVVMPGRLSVGGSFQLSDASLLIGGLNPNGDPTGGTAAQNAQAVATDFPTITYRLMPISGFVRYDPLPDWSAIVRFTYEKFENTDFRSDGLHPATGTDLFLGSDLLPYGANILTVAIAYRFGTAGFGSAAGYRQ